MLRAPAHSRSLAPPPRRPPTRVFRDSSTACNSPSVFLRPLTHPLLGSFQLRPDPVQVHLLPSLAFQTALVVKNLPASAGDVRDPCPIPGQEDPLEEETATHCSVLTWRTPWTEEPGGLQSTGSQRAGHKYSNLARTHVCHSGELSGTHPRPFIHSLFSKSSCRMWQLVVSHFI